MAPGEGTTSEDLIRRTQDGIRTMHADIAKSVPRGEQRVLADAQHQYMHIQEADAIAEAVQALVTATR